MNDLVPLVPSKRSGFKFVCALPKSNSEWRIMPFVGQDGKQRLVAINPEHPPFIIEDGLARELLFND